MHLSCDPRQMARPFGSGRIVGIPDRGTGIGCSRGFLRVARHSDRNFSGTQGTYAQLGEAGAGGLRKSY